MAVRNPLLFCCCFSRVAPAFILPDHISATIVLSTSCFLPPFVCFLCSREDLAPRACFTGIMSMCQVIEADSSLLKRSFDAIRDPKIYDYSDSWKRNNGENVSMRSPAITYQRISRPRQRQPTSLSRQPDMPVQTSAPVPAAFPSFMSVFGGGMERLQVNMREGTPVNDSRGGTQAKAGESIQTHYHLPFPYQHRESAASVDSNSTNSSPTTTLSTFDSPSITDPSPSSPPESPTSLLPLSPFQKIMSAPKQNDKGTEPSQSSLFFQSQPRSESPASKERNVKNLSLNMSAPNARHTVSSTTEGLHAFSAPTSPLRGPMKTGRRRPNNLTIQTPAFDKTTFPASDVPPTPSHRPILKHHGSSPALPSVLSPTTAPLTGMQLPPLSMKRLLSRPGSESSFSSLSVSSQGLHDLKEDAAEVQEPITSQEAQERGYPDGPIRIYDDGVYLYLEPTREEASKFDTVINVAKEVANPFSNPSVGPKSSVVSVWRSSAHSDSSEPRTAVSDISFKSALEWPLLIRPMSPNTPKAQMPEPEYIHVPWDHNSEILDDLYPLCQIMDSRVSSGKSVLVHCQLGVSRSASLVIAYGLYRGFKTDFHSMYTSVKERSPWVGPNMSLIYQLMDFRTKVANGDYAAASKPASQGWFTNASTDNEMTPKPFPVPEHKPEASRPPSRSAKPVEGSASYCSRTNPVRTPPTVPLFNEAQMVARKESLPAALSHIALGSPSAETASASHPMPRSLDTPPVPPRSAKRNAPRPLPLREPSSPWMQMLHIPPRTSQDTSYGTSTARPTSYAPARMDLMLQETPSSPSIFSPRTTEFRALSFTATDAGDLATEKSKKNLGHGKRLSIFSQPQTSMFTDPRSPHQNNGDGGILRRIDDVL